MLLDGLDHPLDEGKKELLAGEIAVIAVSDSHSHGDHGIGGEIGGYLFLGVVGKAEIEDVDRVAPLLCSAISFRQSAVGETPKAES